MGEFPDLGVGNAPVTLDVGIQSHEDDNGINKTIILILMRLQIGIGPPP
jgi:hypothetical protein